MTTEKPKFTLKDAFNEFKKEFPEEAYSTDGSRGFDLTSLKAQYIVERLNDVTYQNNGGWYLTGEYQETDNGVLYYGQLTVSIGEESVIRENVGFGKWAKHSNDGDAYKSAATDCLGKCASHIGIGNEMYKGNIVLKSLEKEELSEEVYDDPEEDQEDEEQETTPSRAARRAPKASRRAPKATRRADSVAETEAEDEENYDEETSPEDEPKLKTRQKFTRGTRFNSGARLNR